MPRNDSRQGLQVRPVLLSGGSGTRLWPASRTLYPKQLLPLLGTKTMLQETALRVAGAGFTAPSVICNEAHRFIVAEQLHDIGLPPDAIVLEPVGRNTAPAAALAALHFAALQPESLLLLLPSDHRIACRKSFLEAVDKAAVAAERGHLVTFGIHPDRPETGYGYIRRSEAALEDLDGVFPVQNFVEKPDLNTAQGYLDSGHHLWNSGMFLFSASRYIDELERLRPDILDVCRKALDGEKEDLDFLRIDAETFASCPAESIDYAVMEHTSAAAVVPVDMGWSDVGSWNSLWEVSTKDEDGNAVHGGPVLTREVSQSYIASDGPLVAAVGVEDLVVVVNDDAVLVASRDKAQDVKGIVDDLKAAGRSEFETHSTVYRPWGHYSSIDEGDRFQVKQIVVHPGAKMSLQMHHHRAEHWVVVQGTARVTRGDEMFMVFENESTFIPVGTSHRLENPGKVPLRLIEIQSGAYLGEDDIVRFDDDYGRG